MGGFTRSDLRVPGKIHSFRVLRATHFGQNLRKTRISYKSAIL